MVVVVVVAVGQCSWRRAWLVGCRGNHQASSPCHRVAAAPQGRVGSCRAATTDMNKLVVSLQETITNWILDRCLQLH